MLLNMYNTKNLTFVISRSKFKGCKYVSNPITFIFHSKFDTVHCKAQLKITNFRLSWPAFHLHPKLLV